MPLTHYLLMGRVIRPQSQSGCSEEVKNILPLDLDIYVNKSGVL